MISFEEFLDKKRKERNRGKLAGMSDEILALAASGASFTEIAEYLHLARGISVTPRGLAKHVRSRKAQQSALPTPAPQWPAPAPTTEALARTPIREAAPHPENASSPIDAIMLGGEDTTKGPPPNDASRSESTPNRYDRNSPEHLAKVARLRLHSSESKT